MPSRSTSIKHMLACVDGTDNDRTVLDHALQVALRFASHIDVLHVRFDPAAVVAGQQRRVDRLLGGPVEDIVAAAAGHARRHFDEWHAQSKLPLRDNGTAVWTASTLWREIVGYESDVIARLGRLTDLIVIARPNQRSSSLSAMALETALFDTSRPVLMVPEAPAANLFRHPLIAWNGSAEAARAVGFALPFLAEIEGGVEIFTAPDRKHRTEPEELVRYLGWHGIAAQRVSASEAGDAGASLLAQASASQAGLIVMGAYTHGHYRQFVFGGVTRHVMQHAGAAVLMAH